MPLGRLLTGAANLPRNAFHSVTGVVDPRKVHRVPGRTHIPVRGVHRPGTDEMAEALRDELRALAGVLRAEVNGPLGLVMVFHDDDVPLDQLIDIVEAIEKRHEATYEPFAGIAHPPDGQALVREAALVGGYLLAGGTALAGRVLNGSRLPPGIPALASMIDSSPQFRMRLEGGIGRTATDWIIGSGVSLTHALAFQPIGPLINSAHRLVRLAEMRGHLQTWNDRSTHLDAGEGAFDAPALHVPERPVPLPGGAVESSAWTIPAAVTAAVGTYAATRDVDRAQGVLAAGVPKAARLGREAFAAQIGIAASIRDVIVFQPEALRRLDRVDRIIVDVSALRTGGLVIEEVVPLGGEVDPEVAYERAYALVDLAEPEKRRKEGPWAVAPYKNGRAEAKAMRERGATVLQLTRDRKAVALISVVAELDPLAEVTLATARQAATVLVAGAGAEVRHRVTVDGTVAGGSRLLTSVQELQEQGHVVMLIAVRGGAALAAADVGVGILGPSGNPPWGAHVLCGPGLADACMLLSALIPARATSMRASRIAVVGSAAGGLLAATGTPERAARRARLAVDAAAVSAFVVGTWSGLSAGRRRAPLPTDRTPWHAWPAQAVLDRLDSSLEGIGEDEAAQRRTEEPAEDTPGLAKITLEELDNPLTPALAAGAGVSAVVGSIMDAALIGSVLGANALMSGVQRVGADRALRQLVDLSAVRVNLRRPGDEETTVTAAELVPGDVVMLSAGDAVPADLRVLSAQGLEIDESSLTGESQLVEKSPQASLAGTVADRTSMLYEGSVVAAGEAVGVVVATGPRTEIGRTARLGGDRRPVGGVEERLRSLTKVTLPIALGAGGVLFLSDLMRGRPIAQALGPAVSLAVAAVPEGLPFVATAAELATARRMSQRGAIVRNPTTIEALGRIDVLCFDKTGTLTMGKLRLRQVSDGVATVPVESMTPGARKIVAAALRASPEVNGSGRLPHPTDEAIRRGVGDLHMDASEGLGTWVRVDELPFEPARGYHAVLGRTDDGQRLSVKGAPEIILDRCTSWVREDGLVLFDETAREKVDQEVDRLARLGYRVLAVAERVASGRVDLTESRIGRLSLLGLVGIADPVRPTAAAAVARLRKAGVDIVMITGDHPTTAEAIAAELGLLNGEIITGAELDELDEDDLAEALKGVSIFARVSPTQKALVVRALQKAGRVVAVTGDGANDAPAIRLADVGIALGEHATSAARETADVVITDERIETITDAVADCRAMWRSTRDALAVLLGGNLGEIAFTLGTGLISGRSPLNVRQLLLVNLLTDMLPAIALASRPPSGISHEELLTEGPEQSLGEALTRDIVIRGTATAGAGMVAWLLGRLTGTRAQADTVGLVALVGTQLAQTVAAGGRDPVVLGAGFASFGALAVIVQVPGLSHFFGSRPLLPHGWAIGLSCALLFAVAAWLASRLTSTPEIASSQVIEGMTT